MMSSVVIRKLQADRNAGRSIFTPTQAVLQGFALAAASSIFLVGPALTLNIGARPEVETTRVMPTPVIASENTSGKAADTKGDLVPEVSQSGEKADSPETIPAPEVIDQPSENAKPAETITTPETTRRPSVEAKPLVTIHAPEGIDPTMKAVIERVNSMPKGRQGASRFAPTARTVGPDRNTLAAGEADKHFAAGEPDKHLVGARRDAPAKANGGAPPQAKRPAPDNQFEAFSNGGPQVPVGDSHYSSIHDSGVSFELARPE